MSEIIGQLNNLELNDVNEKLRIIQRLIDEIYEIQLNTFQTRNGGEFVRNGSELYIETYNDWGY